MLYWLRRPAKYYKPFVSNRVGEIQSVSDPEQWRYVDTKENPADIPTRGEDILSLKCNDLWWHGPSFLMLTEDKWPVNRIDENELHEKEEKQVIQCSFKEVMNDGFRINPKRWSNKRKLITRKRVGYVYRFIQNCRVKRYDRILTSELQLEEWQRAERTLIKMCQSESFFSQSKLY